MTSTCVCVCVCVRVAGCGGASAGKCEACKSCAAGQHTVGCAGQSGGDCQACPAGTFAASAGVRLEGCDQCVTCGSGESRWECSATEGPGRCGECPRGHFWEGKTCRSCCPARYSTPDVDCRNVSALIASGAVKGVENLWSNNRWAGEKVSKVWSFETGGDEWSSPAVSADGQFVYIGSNDNNVYCLRASSGEKVWSFETGGWVISSPAVSTDGQFVYVGSFDDNVWALQTQPKTFQVEATIFAQSFTCSLCASCPAGQHTRGCGQGAGECVDCTNATFALSEGVRVEGCYKCPTCEDGSVAPGCSSTSAGNCSREVQDTIQEMSEASILIRIPLGWLTLLILTACSLTSC